MSQELQRIISIFFDRDKPDEGTDAFLQQALYRIRDGKSRELVEQIRTESDKAKRNKLKGKLPCVCFNGHFLRRANKDITQHSGHIILDFDDVADPEQLKRDLFARSYVKAVWISPSGTGVKCLVRIPNVISQHKGHFAALVDAFEGAELDESGKDEARICYESYDPTILIRDEPDVFEGYKVPSDTPPPPRSADGHARTDYGKLNLCAAMIRNSPDGAKHDTLLKAARLAGGYVAAGAVDEEIAVRILEAEIDSKPGVDDQKGAYKTIRDGIEYGKRVPIYDQVPEEAPSAKTETTHNVVFLASRWEKMKDQHKNGKVRGTPTYMPNLDKHFTWKKKELTLGSGYPNAGKSEFTYFLCLLKSVNEGTKWAVFGPEAGDAEEFYDGLIHALVGRSVDPAYANQMTLTQYGEAAEFVGQHFFFIDSDTEHTIADVEANFEYCIRELGCEGVIIDPYNALADVSGERDDKHLQQFLNKRIRFAKAHDVYYLILAHPKADRKLNKEGEYDAVGFFDMAGGAMWANKVHNFFVVHRPFQHSDPANTTVEIIVRKIKKQRLVGIPGTVRYSFDRGKNRYMVYDGVRDVHYSPLDHINSDATGKAKTRQFA